MKKIVFSIFATMVALSVSAQTTITMADYAATSFKTTDRHFQVTADKAEAATAPAYNAKAADLRIYAKGTLTIEAASEMTNITFEMSKDAIYRFSAENAANVGTLKCDTTDGKANMTWTGSAKKIVITVGEKATLGKDGSEKAGQLRISGMTITGGTEGTLAGIMYEKNFKDSKKGWTIEDKTLPENATFVWQQSTSYGYKASAYVSGTSYAAESWLVSQVFDLTSATQVALSINQTFNKGQEGDLFADCVVKVTKDGTNWEDIKFATMPTGTDWTFVQSEELDITKYISDKFQIAFVYKSKDSNAPTWEIDVVKLVGDGAEIKEEATHLANTPDKPYTVSEAVALIDAGEELTDTVYVIGKVDSLGAYSADYKNANFEITDGTSKLLCYASYGLNKDSIMSEADFQALVHVGDEVIMVGTLTKYGNIYEFNKRCWIYEIKAGSAVENLATEQEKAHKFVRNGQIYIRKNGVEYNILGIEVK